MADEGPSITLKIDTLIKFIDTYDGNRDNLSAWLTNCDRAFDLADDDQKSILFAFVQNKLTDRAQSVCSNTVFNNWEDLKEFLKLRFGNRKHQTHLLFELQNCKQTNENITQYISKIETCLKRLLSCVTQNCDNEDLLPGQLENINQLALHTFLMGVNPHISQILRARNPSDLNDAFNIAIEEEKFFFLQNSRKPNNSNNNPKKCGICHKIGHSTNNCFRQNTNMNKKPNEYKKIFNLNIPKFCKYCRKEGHVIENCFRLKNKNDSNKLPIKQLKHLNLRTATDAAGSVSQQQQQYKANKPQ